MEKMAWNIPSSQKRLLLISIGTLFFFMVLYTSVPNNTFESSLENFQSESLSPSGTLYNFFDHPQAPGVLLMLTSGGLGNQLFEYACAYAVAKELEVPLYIYADPRMKLNSSRRFSSGERLFALDQLNIPSMNIIQDSKVESSMVQDLTDKDMFDKAHLSVPPTKIIRINTYCQSPRLWHQFKAELKDILQPKLEADALDKVSGFLERIQESESVAVHIRRGDALKHNGAYFVPLAYHRVAIRRIEKILRDRGLRPVYFVFSDDIAHTQKHLKDLELDREVVYVSANKTSSMEDFYLMTNCKHIIFPASTFSWWAAFLNNNPDKIVIASAFSSKFWVVKNPRHNIRSIVHGENYHFKEWIVIDPFSGRM